MINPTVGCLNELSYQNLLELREMYLDLSLVHLNELLTKVEIRCIKAVVNSKTLIVSKLFFYLQGLMHSSIIIEENEWPILLSTQGFHPVDGIWQECSEVIALEAFNLYEE